MAKQTVGLGTTANDGTGDPLRTAFDKINDNFDELYLNSTITAGNNITITGNTIASDDTNGDINIDPNGTGRLILATGSELRFTDHVDNAIAFVDADGDVSLSANLTYDGSTALAVTGSVTATTTMQGTTITATTAFVPDASDGAALGTSALQFSDLFLADAAVIGLGDDQDVTITHVADSGITIKSAATADDKPVTITLQTGETDIAAADKLGVINFQAPDEGTGTDAILVAAGIEAVSEGDFSASANATKLSFKTAASAAAAEVMALNSGGDMSLVTDGASIFFGASSEIELRHVADDGLILKHVGTGDGKEPSLTFQAGDNDIAASDLLGSIQFQAPDEGAGTDAILVSAAIAAESEGTSKDQD